jgi:hypothetical protein
MSLPCEPLLTLGLSESHAGGLGRLPATSSRTECEPYQTAGKRSYGCGHCYRGYWVTSYLQSRRCDSILHGVPALDDGAAGLANVLFQCVGSWTEPLFDGVRGRCGSRANRHDTPPPAAPAKTAPPVQTPRGQSTAHIFADVVRCGGKLRPVASSISRSSRRLASKVQTLFTFHVPRRNSTALTIACAEYATSAR